MWPNPQFASDLFTFAEEILNEKLHFFVQCERWFENPKISCRGSHWKYSIKKGFVILKGASKLYFIHYWWVVISLLNTCLFKCAFSTYYIGKLVFRFSLLSLFSVCSSCHLYKSFFTVFATFMLPLFIQVPAAMWFFFLTLKNSPNKPITEENIFLERFWVFKKYFTYKEVSEQLQDERM